MVEPLNGLPTTPRKPQCFVRCMRQLDIPTYAEHVLAHLWLGQAYEQKGNHKQAIAEIQKSVALLTALGCGAFEQIWAFVMERLRGSGRQSIFNPTK